MASPFRYFRKNSKIMLAVFVVLLMFSWIIGDSLFNLFGTPRGGATPRARGGDVAVHWDGGSLTNQQLNQMVMLRRILNAFLQQVENEGAMSAFTANVEPAPLRVQRLLGPETPQQQVEQSVVETRLFADAAREAGMRVSDDMLRQYLYHLGRGNVTPQQMRDILKAMQQRGVGFSIDEIMGALRDELLARNFIHTNQYSFRTVTPDQRWKDWLRLNKRVIVEVAAIPTESFLVDVKEPTDAELQEFYDKFKEREMQPDRIGTTELPSATPGFRVPRKIDVAYLEANYDGYVTKAEEKVTEAQISKFYEEQKDKLFIKADTGLFEDKPLTEGEKKTDDTKADDTKADTTPASDTPVEPQASPSGPEPSPSTEPSQRPKAADGTSDGGADDEDTSPQSPNEPPGDAANEEGKSSSSGLHFLNPYAVVTLLQAEPSDEKAEEKSEEKTEPAAPASPVSEGIKAEVGEAAKSEAIPASTAAPGAEPPAADTAPTPQADAKKPVEYQPLDEVKDVIRRTIAEQNVHEELTKLMNQIQGELQAEFEKYLNVVFAAETEKGQRPAPPKALTDLSAVAEKHGLTSGSTGPMSFLDFRETAVGKSRVADTGFPLADWMFSGSDPELFEPRLTEANIDGNRFLVLKTSDTPGKVPALADVRDEVVKAWKAQRAAELAEKSAKEIAEKAEESKANLSTFFADKPDMKVVRTDLFSELTAGDVGVVNGRVVTQYRLSQPDGIATPGPSFMKEVFSLKDGEVGAALNNDKSVAYVIRLVEHQPSMSELRTAYLAEANTWPGFRTMIEGHAREVASNLAADVMTNANLKWERTPDEINRDSADGG